ncbi:uncharacterized protein E0L32_001207 [Thyridium curvatum]|uniref:ribonuclease T1 n=1 Tax=Thyridium curvatum TaxID=1093900 RepID=A0A507B270_9PEZI|nr:uncharacterized protein E0L32_001207 [Thyridium curvatum]TPX11389.1 hypothetical protein E0L32_001207 [Thyridium curvatum]
MVALKSCLLSLLAAALAAAAPVEPVQERATCVYHCGSVCYWQEDIDNALNQGVSLHNSGSTLGHGSYPHEYRDSEGFDFPTSGPWYEFPILSSYQVYSGGSPGPDRVIFDDNGQFDALITHTGASGNNFVACSQG